MKSEQPLTSIGDTVISGGYCVGCGACASLKGSVLSMQLSEIGTYEPVKTNPDAHLTADCNAVCPFSENQRTENDIFPETAKVDCQFHPKIGFYHAIYGGYVATNEFREAGSSGGFITWLSAKLLEDKAIDGVIHVVPKKSKYEGVLFEYSISRTVTEVAAGAKSHYYPVEFSKVINEVRNSNGRYMFVGVPCFVKAVRLLADADSSISEKIPYYTAIFCGHLKSTGFAESLGMQLGVSPHELESIDFRVKDNSQPANQYGVSVVRKTAERKEPIRSPMKELLGADWGLGLFKLKACDYCDDITGECADVSIGDAWINPYIRDGRGNNVVVVRNKALNGLITKALQNCELDFDPLAPGQVITSQASNFRHRHDGLQFRLWLADRMKVWRPGKRLNASSTHLSKYQKQIFLSRIELREESHRIFAESKKANDISIFKQGLAPLIEKYRQFQDLERTKPKRFPFAVINEKYLRYYSYYKSRCLSYCSRAWLFNCLSHVAIFGFRVIRSLFKNERSAVILPAISAGGIGDDAMVASTIRYLRGKGISRICLLSYPISSGVIYSEKVDDVVDMAGYVTNPSRRGIFEFVYRTWRYNYFFQIGADVMDGFYSPQRSMQRLTILKYAAKTGMNATILGFSFNEKPDGVVLQHFHQLPDNVRICFRDPVSQERFSRHLPDKISHQTADIAFLLEPTNEDTCSFHRNLARLKETGTLVIGINVIKTSTFHGLEQSEDASYFDVFNKLILRLRNDFKHIAFAFVPHDYRPEISDVTALAHLYRGLATSVQSSVLMPDKILTAAEVKHSCRYLDFVISSRMHFAIACLGQGVPVASVGYQGKFEGLYRMFGLPQLLLDKRTLLSDFEKSYAEILSLILERAKLAEQIKTVLPNVVELSESNFSSLLRDKS